MMFFSTTKEDVSIQLEDVIASCNYEMLSQKQKLNTLLQILQNINSVIQTTDYFEETNTITDFLKSLKMNIDHLRSNVTNLQGFMDSLNVFSRGLKESPNELDIPYIVETFNQVIKDSRNDVEKSDAEFYNLILEYVKKTNFNNVPNSITNNPSENTSLNNYTSNNTLNYTSNDISDDIDAITADSEITDNRILTISEKQKKVFLPYYVEDLKYKLRHNRSYKSLQDVIKKEYILPISKFKSPIIARFRESYNLMRKREKASISDSLDLALGLTFNSALNPAIITACKNLEELEAYLDCLELNELSKFEFFEIKYEILPFKR